MKMLVDMNLSPQWVGLLARSGIEAAHWSSLGAVNAPDTEIMAYARIQSLVVLTNDLDFSAILAVTHGEMPSVVQVRARDLSIDAIGQSVVSAILQMARELEEGALLTIDPGRARLRILPLQQAE
jgi:predicted nuclease of predicted toxin-antitoxin system